MRKWYLTVLNKKKQKRLSLENSGNRYVTTKSHLNNIDVTDNIVFSQFF
jgi:urease beta subunit